MEAAAKGRAMKRIWILRKSREGVSPVIATILLVAVTVVLAAILYVMALGIGGPGTVSPPVFGTNEGGDPNNYSWTLTAISGGRSVLKTDVYVQLRNSSDNFLIQTTPLATADGTHGFKYKAASTGDFIGVGDIFSLSRDYTQGTVLTLVTAGATGQYAMLTI